MRTLLFILTLLTLSFTGAEAQVEKLKPDSSKDCALCHYEWMPEFLYESKGTPLVEFQKEKVVAHERMCFSCHNGTVGDSRIRIWTGDVHKLEKIPAHMNIPGNLPLSIDGKMDCRTCHSAHSTGDPKEEGVEKSVFLRVENNNSELCRACHTDIGSTKMGITHPMTPVKENTSSVSKKIHELNGKLGTNNEVICQSCHTPHSPKEEKLLINHRNHSELCATCHTTMVSNKDSEYLKGMLNHPINIEHENLEKVNKIKKEGGSYGLNNEVICLTCHSVHKAKTDTLLYRKNSDNSLCFVCHETQNTILETKHDMKTIKGFRTKDGKTAQEKGTCESCHDPHGWSLQLPKTDDDMITKGCLSCHQNLGIAKEKVINTTLFNHPVGKDIAVEMKNYEKLPLFGEVKKFFTEIGTDKSKNTMVTCATCHNVHGKDKNFLRVEATSGALCIVCHDNKKMIENTAHGQEKLKKGCMDCHKIHNSESKRLLVQQANDGCMDCHKPGGSAEKKLIGEHSHPVNVKTQGKVDERFKIIDGNFTCSSCHDPHMPSKKGKIEKDFIRGGFDHPDDFCSACHEGKNEVKGSAHDVRDKVDPSNTTPVCSQCHSVHQAKTSGNIMSLEFKYKTEDDYCNVCHNDKGTAKKKTVKDGHKTGKIENHEKYTKLLTEKDGNYYLYCSTCHTVHNNGPKKGTEGTFTDSFLNKELMKEGNFCQSCHADKKDFTRSKHNVVNFETHMKEFEKAKAEGNTCGACHMVHNSGYYLFDKKLGNDFETICKTCHSTGKVAAKSAVTTSHPTNVKLEKKLDVYLLDGKIVCSTCHDVHGAVKGMVKDLGESNLCLTCHADQKTVVYSEHNLAMLNYMDDKTKVTAETNPCYVCHMPHNFHKDNELMWAFEHKKGSLFAFDMCLDCHQVNGVGYKKVPEATNHDRIFKIFPFKEQYKEFLYDDKGKVSANGSITCQTCHDPHVWKKGSTSPAYNVDGTLEDSFLKLDAKVKFCNVCHGDDTDDLFNKYHDKAYREGRNKQIGEAEVLRNLFKIQQNLQKIQGN